MAVIRGSHGRWSPSRTLVRVALLAVVLVTMAGCGPALDPANAQEQIDEPAGLLGQGRSVSQTFLASCDGLTAIDLLVARYPELPATRGQLIVQLREVAPGDPGGAAGGGRLVAEERLSEADLQPNQWIRLAVSSIAHSRGQYFRIDASTTDDQPAPITLWSTAHPGPPNTARWIDRSARSGAFVYRVFCDETPVTTLRETAQTVGRGGLVWPAALLLGVLPGAALASRSDRSEQDLAAFLGSAIGWSILIAPVSLVLATPMHLGVHGEMLGCLVSAIVVARHRPPCRLDPWSGLALLSTVIALGIRAIEARGLVAPAWGDPIQHSYVAKLILETGGVPSTYGPLVPPQVFDYHFGFQAIAAAAASLSGANVAEAVLAAGQILDALSCLATYRLGRDLTGSSRVGAIAAVLVGLVMTQPAYFVSWGRYPELAALVALPAAFAAIRRALGPETSLGELGIAAGAVAALVLVHPRVAIFLAALSVGTLVADTVAKPQAKGTFGGWQPRSRCAVISRAASPVMRLGMVGVLAFLLLFPWASRLWQVHHSQVVLQPSWQPIDFPIALATAGNDRWVLIVALGSLIVGFIWRPALSIALAVTGLIIVVIANPATFHLSIHLFVNNGSVAIALFLPASILTGSLLDLLGRSGRLVHWPIDVSRFAPLGILAFGLTQAPALTTIVNPYCILLRPDDLAAIAWVRSHTASDAHFLINGFPWMDSIWMGSDAGYWLPVLADRSTNLPPLFYAVGPADQVAKINDLALEINQDARNGPALARVARRIGARYVFIGSRGGALDPGALVASGRFRVDYRAGGAWVLETVDPGPDTSSTETASTPVASEAPSDSKAAGLRSTTPG